MTVSDTEQVAVARPYQDHYARLYFRVIDDPGVDKVTLATYVALCRFADWSNGTLQVSRAKLAKVARLSVRALDTGLTKLVELGYLAIDKHQREDGSWAASCYALRDTAASHVPGGGAGCAPCGAEPAPGGGASPAPPSAEGAPSPAPPAPGVAHPVREGGAQGAHQEQESFNKRPSNENTPPPPAAETALPGMPEAPPPADAGESDRDQFEDFWSVYPRHIGKEAARSRWQTVVKARKVDPAVVIAAAAAYAAQCDGKEPRYIAHPSTWLNQGRYGDEPEAKVYQHPTAGRSEDPPPEPEWCGRCDEYSRLFEKRVNGYRVADRCPDCYPRAAGGDHA